MLPSHFVICWSRVVSAILFVAPALCISLSGYARGEVKIKVETVYFSVTGTSEKAFMKSVNDYLDKFLDRNIKLAATSIHFSLDGYPGEIVGNRCRVGSGVVNVEIIHRIPK